MTDRRPPRGARKSPPHGHPPLVGRLLLRLRLFGGRRAEIEADLDELFHQRWVERGKLYAALRYCSDAMSLWTHRREHLSQPEGPPDRETIVARRCSRLGALRPQGLILDLRFAIRMFRRQIAAFSVTVAGLALAIGAITVVFGVVNAGMLPAPGGLGRNASSIMEVNRVSSSGSVSRFRRTDEFLRLRGATRLVQIEAYFRESAPLGETSLEEVRVTLVSGGFFEMFGARAAIGRVLTNADDAAGAAPAVVISHTFWKQRFGSDKSILGQTVRLLGTPFTVVGVIEDGFVGPTGGAWPPAFWAPLATYEPVWRPTFATIVRIIGRVAEGATPEQAEAEISAAYSALAAQASGDAAAADFRTQLARPRDQFSDPDFRWFLAALGVILGLVLLLACTNVANLLLAGAIARRREVGLRLALGASRGRVIRQLLTESVLLGALSGTLGLLFALWLLPFVPLVIEVPDTIEMAADLRVYGFVVFVTLLAGILAGLAPARYGVGGDLAGPLKGDVAGAGRCRRPGRVRSVLIGAQAAASIVLLILAALLTRSMVHVTQTDIVADVDRLVGVTSRFEAAGYDAAAAADFWDRALTRVATLPGVERAALAEYMPFGARGFRSLRVERDGARVQAQFNLVSPDYFATVGIPVVRGRTFSAVEAAGDAPVAIVSERLAGWLWEGEDPLGDTLARIANDMPGFDASNIRVVGIAADSVMRLQDPQRAATLYFPLGPEAALRSDLVVRARDDAATIVGPVFEAIRALDPRVLPAATEALDAVRTAHQPMRMLATAAGALGTIALGLAIIGIAGLTAFTVEQRTAEIGVRLAIGASAPAVVRLMLRDSLRPVATGLLVGLLVAIGAGNVLTAVLYGISPRDPLSILAAVAILLAATALAAAVPTRRAARIDPAVVLRRD